jgi:predicted phage terminase large subunit-like protein
MDQKQIDLIIDFTYKHFGKDAESILTEYPLTGPGGLRRMLGELDPEFFCLAYLPDQFEREFAEYSRTILYTLKNVIESDAREKQAIVAPREHGKSTFSSFAMPTWAACYKKKKFIFFISANGATASNFLEKTKKALESPAITEDFGPQKGKVWNSEEICLKNGVWISCSGWTSGLRGLNKDTRPDLIALDDLEDKSVMESDSLRKKLETCFNEEIGRLGTYNTDFFYIGTLLSEDSLLARVIKMPSWKSLILKRVITFPDNDGELLWEQWRKIYCNISNENRFDDAWNFYIKNKETMLRGVKVLWEEKVPSNKTKYPGGYYNVMLDRVAFGEDAFFKEDQNEPRNSSDKHFKTMRYWQDLYEELPKIEKLKLAVDPSEGKGLDSTGYALGGKINGGICIQEGQLRNDKLGAIMKHTEWFINAYPDIDEVIIEENTYKEDGTEELRKYLVEKGVYRKVTGFRSTTNKHNRIIQMEPDINEGLILFNKLNVQFNNEILGYHAKAPHDDAADCTQALVKTLKTPDYYMK